MDYKKIYEEALARAKSKIRNDKDHVLYEDDILDIFPELKESEDERIRKEIIDFAIKANNGVTSILANNYNFNKWIAWLEKQGEQKFKVGNWVAINPELRFASPLYIRDNDNNNYRVESVDGNSGTPTIDYLDRNYHLWTIADAKDGDVLVDKDNNIGLYQGGKDKSWISYVYLGCDNSIRSFGGYHKCENTKPATKEQRDLLFSKMKEAGYEWDFEKKELKKIEQNPAWGEEEKHEVAVTKN